MTVTANYLVTVTREMGQAMQNTAYSPIFNEALDFSCAVFDEVGDMIGQGEFCPAQLGATTMALRWIINEFGLDWLGMAAHGFVRGPTHQVMRKPSGRG